MCRSPLTFYYIYCKLLTKFTKRDIIAAYEVTEAYCVVLS